MPELNLSKIDLNLFVVFDSVMAERSVSRAADKLNLTQSGVSRALARFRGLMGDPLFVKTPAGMQPTTLSETIAPEISRVLANIRDIIHPPEIFYPQTTDHTFTIGLTDYMSYVLLPGLIEKLRTVAPRVKLIAMSTNVLSSVGMIERGEVDLIVGRIVPDMPANISHSPLFQTSNVCVARGDHPAFAGPLTKDAFLAYDHLHISPWGKAGLVDEVLRRHGAIRQRPYTVAHFLSAPAILERTDLITIVPSRVATHLVERYGMAAQPSPFDLGIDDMVQLWHRRLDKDAALRWLRAEIEAMFPPGGEPVFPSPG